MSLPLPPVGAEVDAPAPELPPVGAEIEAPPHLSVVEPQPTPEQLDAQRDDQLRTLFEAGLQQAPDERAGILEIARRTGLKPDLVESQYPLLRKRAEAAGFDVRRFREENPGLEDLLLQDPAAAGVVMRDEQLSVVTKALRGLGRLTAPLEGEPDSFLERWQANAAIFGSDTALGTIRAGARVAGARPTPEAPAPKQIPTVEAPEAELEGLARVGIYGAAWRQSRQQAELARLGSRLLFAEVHGDRTYDLEKRILAMQQETGPARSYRQGGVEQVLLDAVETVASQVDPLKGGGVGGALGAGGFGAVVGGATRNPALARSAAKVGWKLGSRTGAFLASLEQETGSAYLEIRALRTDDGRPVDRDIARGAAVVYGLTAAGVEVVALGPMLKAFGPFGEALAKGEGRAFLKSMLADRTMREVLRGAGKAWARAAAAEGAEEAVQETLQFLAAHATKRATAGEPQEFDAEELVDRAAVAAYKGALGGGLLAGGGAVVNVSTQVARIAASERAALQVQAIAGLAESPSIKASPELVAKMIERETAGAGEPVTHAYVDAGAFTRLFQSRNADPEAAARELLGEAGPEKLRQAQAGALGGRIEIPLPEYLEKWGPKGVAEALAPDTAVRPGLLTPREIVEHQDEVRTKAEELKKTYLAENAPEPESLSERRLVDIVQQQLSRTGTYKAGDAKEAVALTRALLRTQAEIAGVAPDELFDDYVITVGRGVAEQARAPDEAAQAEIPGLESLSPETKAFIREAIGQDVAGAGAKLARKAFLDTLTPAGNKAAYQDFLARPRKGVHVAIDLNKFKAINDTLGHDVGDKAIAAAGEAFAAASRAAGGKLFRPGGDEFTAHFDTLEQARAFVADAQARFEALPAIAEGRKLSFSAGLGRDPKTADAASYKAKEVAHAASDLLTAGRGYVAWDESGIEPEPTRAAQAQLLQGERGFVEMAREGLKRVFRIVLTEKADLSTFLHESAHVYLELLGDLAAREKVPQRIRQDWQTTLEWLGAKDRASLTREQHEKWARAFEAYLMEGKAPTAQLAGAFQHFKLWLRSIYRALPPEQLDDRIRGVFDRLLATDEEIERMKAAMGADRPVFRSPDEAGMTPAQFQAYLDEREKSFARAALATQRRVVEAQAQVTEKWWKDEAKKLDREARAEFDRRPEARAWAYVKRGDVVLEDGRTVSDRQMGKLDRELVEKAYGKDPRLEKALAGRIVKEGEDPADVARQFGFGSARELLQALVNLPDRVEWAKAEAERRMREKYPHVLEERSRLAEIAAAALHNEGTADWLLKEAVALRSRAQEGKPVPVEAIREAAREIVQDQAVRRLNAHRALQAERAAAEEAFRAAATGDFRLAYVAKQKQLLNHYLFRELGLAREGRERFEEFAGTMVERRRREVLGKGGRIFLDAGDSLLEALGFKDAASPDEVAARATTPEWMKGLEDAGIVPGFAAARISEIVARPPATWKDLSVGDVRMLDAALRQLYTAARDMNMVVHLGKRVQMDALAGEIAAEAARLPKKQARPGSESAAPVSYWAKQRVSGFLATLADPEQIIENLGSTARKFFWERYTAQRAVEDELTRKVSRFFAEKWDALPKKLQERRYELLDPKLLELVPFPEDLNREGESRDRQWAWMLALNMGNRSNMDRLLGGYGWSEENVRKFLDQVLSDDEWTFLESVWDLLDRELYPEVAKAYEQVNGIKPEKIEALPFTLASGRVIRGGYFPARYDPVASRVGADQSIDALTKMYAQKAGAFSVAKSFTKERVKEYSDVINLQWAFVPSHVANVIHYVAFDSFVRDAARVLNHPEVQRTIEQRLGQKFRPQLESWLRTVATAQNDAIPEQLEDMYHPFLEARSRFVMSTLGYSLSVAAGDLTNPLVAIASGRVKARYMVPALVQAVPRYVAMRRAALERSPELRHRSENLRHNLRHQLAELGRQGKRGPGSRLLDATRDTAWVFMEWTDRLTATVIWEGAYRQAAAKGAGEADARAEADAAVRAMLPSHDAAEQPAFLRDKRGMGALVAFYGYFSKLYNVQRGIWHEPLVAWENAEGFSEKLSVVPTAAHAAGRALAVFFVANVLSEFLSGRGPEDDEEWPEWMLRKLLASPFNVLPLVGALAEDAAGRLTSHLWHGEAKHRSFSLRASPAAAGVERLAKAIMRIADEEKDVDDRIWTLLELFGFVFKTPIGARQVTRTGRYVTSDEGLRDDLGAGDVGEVLSGLTYGERDRQPVNPFTVGR